MANIPGTPTSDVIYGTDFDDILNQDGDPLSYPGTGGEDNIAGLGGNDRLYGGTGNDTLSGGTGDDRLSGGSDNDTLYGDSGQDQLFGGAGNDDLRGGDGSDLLDGGAGADGMNGGAGNDIYYVDDVRDGAFEDSNDALGGTDTVRSSVNYTLGLGMEYLELTGTSNLIGVGNEKNNQIVGNNGNDTLIGGDGDDNLYGGDFGDDILNGDAGNDVLVGHAGRDLLNGGTGADVMDGGLGNDTYVVDNLSDQANDSVKLQDDNGVDLVQASVTHTLGLRIENLTLTGTAVINGTGNELNNILTGNGANNVLSGLDGNDVLTGLAGNDTLNGGNGNDVLTGGSGRDQLNGGAGADRFDYNAVSESPSSTGRDIITGFVGAGTALGDQLDLRDIDANLLVSGNQAFTWKGATPGGAGTLWYSGGVLYGNIDGDATPEFQIQLIGSPALSVGGTGTDILL